MSRLRLAPGVVLKEVLLLFHKEPVFPGTKVTYEATDAIYEKLLQHLESSSDKNEKSKHVGIVVYYQPAAAAAAAAVAPIPIDGSSSSLTAGLLSSLSTPRHNGRTKEAAKREPAAGNALAEASPPDVGCLCEVVHAVTSGSKRQPHVVLLDVTWRVRLLRRLQGQHEDFAAVEVLGEEDDEGTQHKGSQQQQEALMFSVREKLVQFLQPVVPIHLLPRLAEKLKSSAASPSRLAFLAAAALSSAAPPDERQKVLEASSGKERLELVLALLMSAMEMRKLSDQIDSKLQATMNSEMREALLLRKMAEIQRALRQLRGVHSEGKEKKRDELFEEKEEDDDTTALAKDLHRKPMSDEARKVARRDLSRLGAMRPHNAEYNVLRGYLETLGSLPWGCKTPDVLRLDEAAIVLDEDHYGIDNVKKRILEFLAVLKVRGDMRGPILCLHGPPGVGKTSLGESIARALGRKFQRISLGGLRDEAELRGHRRTYVGAMPGVFIQALISAGTSNPVLLLDEVDKLAFNNPIHNPSAALLEVLDSAQNHSFKDRYLGIPFDLSQVFFLCTANSMATMPAALRDRLEVIVLSSYTTIEKLHIARDHLLPKQLAQHGLGPAVGRWLTAVTHPPPTENNDTNPPPPTPTTPKTARVVVPDEVLEHIICRFTAESGVRELDRCLAGVCRWSALQLHSDNLEANKHTNERVALAVPDLADILGIEQFSQNIAERLSTPGVAMGLAVSSYGGDILFIEATCIKGTGKLIVTGQLGDVMQESVRTALSLVQAKCLLEHSRATADLAPAPAVLLGPAAGGYLGSRGNAAAAASHQLADEKLWQLGDSLANSSAAFVADLQQHGGDRSSPLLRDAGSTDHFSDERYMEDVGPFKMGFGPERFNAIDVHVHFPAGAIAKGQIVRSDVAFSGEITLRGLVLPVGGIKEKVLAAHRGGVRRIVLPHSNEPHLKEIPSEVLNDLRIIPVKSVDGALFAAFDSSTTTHNQPPPGTSPEPSKSRNLTMLETIGYPRQKQNLAAAL
eukprot:GHVS01088470.1.p1 GENE.GHVS01088470.1~~GHVS01088470.1.p1  ORF type:complete len:1021 (+),score=173.86 GHVS01088470.1:1-3063(+)